MIEARKYDEEAGQQTYHGSQSERSRKLGGDRLIEPSRSINMTSAHGPPVIHVHLTGQLRDLSKGASQVEVDAAEDLKAMVMKLDSRFPGMGQRILDDQEKIRQHVNIFVNSENSRELEREKTKLKDNDVVHILPAVSGG